MIAPNDIRTKITEIERVSSVVTENLAPTLTLSISFHYEMGCSYKDIYSEVQCKVHQKAA